MLLHDIEVPNIYHMNSLKHNLLDYTDADKFDVILMNPPYGGHEDKSIQGFFPDDLASSETADLFMSVILYASERKISGDKVKFHKGQVLYSKLRPYLKKILVAPDEGICTPELVPFDTYLIDANYIAYVLRSPFIDYRQDMNVDIQLTFLAFDLYVDKSQFKDGRYNN